jgi:hypothetical protein
VERTLQDLVMAVVRRRTPPGVSVVVEGAPGAGKTFLARAIAESVPPGAATILRVVGESGHRLDPFAGAQPLLGDMPLLRRVPKLAAGNPLFVAELLRAYQDADALAEAGPDSVEARFELDSRGTGLDEMILACSLVLFTVLAIAGFTGSAGTDRWLATWAAAGVGLVMGLVILVLVPVIPFTEQFARQSTPQAYWSSPTFKQINRVLSLTLPA